MICKSKLKISYILYFKIIFLLPCYLSLTFTNYHTFEIFVSTNISLPSHTCIICSIFTTCTELSGEKYINMDIKKGRSVFRAASFYLLKYLKRSSHFAYQLLNLIPKLYGYCSSPFSYRFLML